MKNLFAAVLVGCLVLATMTIAEATPYMGADIELNGIGYSDASGPGEFSSWYEEGNSIYTCWDNTWIEFSTFLDVGNWNIGINMINYGMLGDDGWYTAFQVLDNLTNTVMTTTASSSEVNSNYFNLDVATAAMTTVRYTWLNDKWAPSLGLDANLQITSAFFDNTATPIPTPEPSTLILLGAGLISLVALRRKG